MEKPEVSISFFLDASRPNKDNKCLVKLKVYQKPYSKAFATKFHLTKDEWIKLNSPKLRDENLKEIKKKLNALKITAEKAAEKLELFSFVAFEEAFITGVTSKFKFHRSTKLEDGFNETIKKLNANEQVGTAGLYQTTINSINNFKKNLHLQDITSAFLQSYEKHLINEEKSLSTISIYMRNLRAIINAAIKDKIISWDNYAFKDYEMPAGQNVKKALKDSHINQLLHYQPKKVDQQRALDFWIFSYLCSGINFADVILLKAQNINGSHLSFYRQKTIRTKKKDLRPIKVGLNPRVFKIIEKWKNIDAENPYLFPILEPGLGAKTIKNRCQRFIKWVNKRMYQISEELGIENKTGTYAARHTFSTVMKRKGIPTSFIKDALGHSSISTTENYLDTFEDDVTLKYASELTNFEGPVSKAV
jgi:integrase/recombinase XerD